MTPIPTIIPAVSMNDTEDLSILSTNECRLLLDCYVDKDRLLKNRPLIYNFPLNDTGLNGYIFKIFQLKVNNRLTIIIAVRNGRHFYLKRGIVNRFPDDITWDADDLKLNTGAHVDIFESATPIRYTEFENKLWIANLATDGKVLITDGTSHNTLLWTPDVTMESSSVLVKHLKPTLIENFTGKIFLVDPDEPYIIYFTMPYDRAIYDDRFIKVGDTKPINDILIQHGKFYVKKDDKIYQVMGLETGLRGNDAACIPVSDVGGYEPASKLHDIVFFLGNDKKLYTLDRNLQDLSTLKMEKFLSKVLTKEMLINPSYSGTAGMHNWDNTFEFSFPQLSKNHIEIVGNPTRLRCAYDTDENKNFPVADTFTNPTFDITKQLGNNEYGPYYNYFFFRVDANSLTGVPTHITSAFRLYQVKIKWGAVGSGSEHWELYHFPYINIADVKSHIPNVNDPPNGSWTDCDPDNPGSGVATADVTANGTSGTITFTFPKNKNGDYPLVHNNFGGFNAGWLVLRRAMHMGNVPLPITGFQALSELVGNIYYLDPADNLVKIFEISGIRYAGSETRITMELGEKTFIITGTPTNYFFGGNEQLRIEDSQFPYEHSMFGNVTSWNAPTGELTINITQVTGSGTFEEWNICRQIHKMHMRMQIIHKPYFEITTATAQLNIPNAAYFTGFTYNCEYPLVYHGWDRKGKISVRISTLDSQGFEQGRPVNIDLYNGTADIPIMLSALNGQTIKLIFTFTPETCSCTTETIAPLLAVAPFLYNFGIRWLETNVETGVRAYYEPKYVQTNDARYMLCVRNGKNFILRHGLGFSLYKLWSPFDMKIITDFTVIDKYIVMPYQAGEVINVSSAIPSILYFAEDIPDKTDYNCLNFYPTILSKNVKNYEYVSPDRIVFYGTLEHLTLSLFIGAPIEIDYDNLDLKIKENRVRNVKIIEQPNFTEINNPYLFEHYNNVKMYPFTSYCKNLILRDIQIGLYGKNVNFSGLPKFDLYLLSISDGVLTGKN